MLAIARKQLRSIAMLAVAAALVVRGGAAAAQSNPNGAPGDGKPGHEGGPPPGPPTMGIAMPGLTNGVLHVQNKEGDEETIRVDQGKGNSLGSDSLGLT